MYIFSLFIGMLLTADFNCIFNRKLCCIVYLVILSMKGNETQASKSKYGKNISTGGKPEILR